MTPLAIYWLTCGVLLVYIDRDFHGWDWMTAFLILVLGGVLLPIRIIMRLV